MVWNRSIARRRRNNAWLHGAQRRGFAFSEEAGDGGKAQGKPAPETPASATLASEEEGFSLCPEFTSYIIQEYILGHEAALPVESDQAKPVHGEIALWRAVITQALMDALNRSAKCEMRYEKSQAGVWLEGRMEDFFTVCHYAQLDPGYVRNKARRALAASRRARGRRGGAHGEKQEKAAPDPASGRLL